MPDREPPLPGSLTRLRTELAGPRGYKRVEALLMAPDPAAAVAALSPPELYELVHQVGFADTAELVALATPAQLRGCLDIEIWEGDRPLVEPMKPWLAAIIDGGYEKFGAVWEGLDAEIRAIFLQKHAIIYDLYGGQEPEDHEETAADLYFTPDTFFCLKLTGSEDTRRLMRQLVEDLYRADPVLARHSILSAHSEPIAELEEMAFRWRSGRMTDLGYVDFHDALDLFQPLEPDQVAIGEGTEERFTTILDGDEALAPRNIPATIAEQVVSRSFLARSLERVDDEAESMRLESAVVVLTNKVLSAARIKPGDLEALRRGAHYATATVSMGLEVVARGDVERGAAALRSVSLTRLHRVGYTVTLRLARLARGLLPRAATAGDPAHATIEALLGSRPWMSRVLDQPPEPGVRPFESQADLRRAAEVLARLGLRIAVAERLGVDLIAMAQAPEPRPALDDHARTALVRAISGGPLSAAALSTGELRQFRADSFADGALTDAAQDRGLTAITGALDAAGITAGREQLTALVAGWMTDLETTFGPLDPATIDGRFVDGVLVASQQS